MKKILTISIVCVLVLFLTGCNACGGTSLTKTIQEVGKGDGFFVFILVRPIAWIMNLFVQLFGNRFGWGIICTTILIRTIAWPVYAKSNDMSLKMQLAQPELTRIQNKYATRQDPISKQKQQQEMMAVWKKYSINPFGCLMVPLIQMPLFMAMYQAVQRYPILQNLKKDGTVVGVSMFAKTVGKLETKFCGIDLSKGITNLKMLGTGSNWIFMIFPLLVGITMFLCQWVSQKKPSYVKQIPQQVKTDQQKQSERMMKFFMYFMVVMMTYISIQNMALALYWVIGNTYTIGQTIVNRKINEKKYYKLKEKNNIIDSILGDGK